MTHNGSTMSHIGSTLLHNDSPGNSFIFFQNLVIYLAGGKPAYVSLGFSIKGRPNLAQGKESILILNHHQSSLLILKSSSTCAIYILFDPKYHLCITNLLYQLYLKYL